MYETPAELQRLQDVLDASFASAGPHMASIITGARRLSADQLVETMQGMCLLVVGTVTADGRPILGPVDGYLLHGSLYFSSGQDSVRMRHLAARPAISATYLPTEDMSVTVHGSAEIFPMSQAAGRPLRQAMLDWYLPRQGPAFEEWLDRVDPIAARIEPDKIFTFHLVDDLEF